MEQVRQAYGVVAKQYIELFGRTTLVHPDDVALIVQHLSMRRGTVLDVGCGPGHHTAHLRSLGVNAIGIDLVPEFIDHARAADPSGRYGLASMHQLPVPDRSIDGLLAWYSLIHLAPADIEAVVTELRRVMVRDGTLVVGFFDGDDVVAFAHKVVTAYHWPVDELSAVLQRAGFTEIDRQRRPGTDAPGLRPHAAIVAIAD